MAPKKTTTAAAPAPTPEAPPAEAPAAAAPTEEQATGDVSSQLTALLAIVQGLANSVRELTTGLKAVQKSAARLQKEVGKRGAGKRASRAPADGAPRRLSGFAKPTGLSKELCDFLGLPGDTKLARTEVTRLLNKYIKDNGLQDKEDKRKIKPDAKLSKLLKLDGKELTYFNLQSVMKPHFQSVAVAAN